MKTSNKTKMLFTKHNTITAISTANCVSIITPIDSLYGVSRVSYSRCSTAKGMWRVSFSPATNWDYCPCCATPADSDGVYGCNCNTSNPDSYTSIDAHTLLGAIAAADSCGLDVVFNFDS
jgi:hypothetical protein